MDADRQCTAKARRTGSRCKRSAIPGGTVCSMHGGKAPAVKAAAERRLQTQAIQKDIAAVLSHEAIEPIQDPVLALAELAAEVRATVKALGARVNALSEISYMSALGIEQTKAEITLLGEGQDRLARILTALGRFDLDERRVRLSEKEAAILAEVIHRVLSSLNLPHHELVAAQEFTAITIREVTAGEVVAS